MFGYVVIRWNYIGEELVYVCGIDILGIVVFLVDFGSLCVIVVDFRNVYYDDLGEFGCG